MTDFLDGTPQCMIQADVSNFTLMCEYFTLRDLNGAWQALQPHELLLSLTSKCK